MQALGLIETRGLVAAVESADAMLKAADVTLVEKTYVRGGLVSITVTGDVAAVKAAVDAGVAAVKQLNGTLLISQHVIPRPHEELDCLIGPVKPFKHRNVQNVKAVQEEAKEQLVAENTENENKDKEIVEDAGAEETVVEDPAIDDKDKNLLETNREELNKDKLDEIVSEYGLTEALEVLNKLKVTKLRKLAREYKRLKIAGRLISKADKKTLLAEFKEYYEI